MFVTSVKTETLTKFDSLLFTLPKQPKCHIFKIKTKPSGLVHDSKIIILGKKCTKKYPVDNFWSQAFFKAKICHKKNFNGVQK